MSKTLAEIIATEDAEEAFLLAEERSPISGQEPPTREQHAKLGELAAQFMAQVMTSGSLLRTLKLFSSDANRRRMIEIEQREGDFNGLIQYIVDPTLEDYRPLFLAYFLERCDDPGYYDELLALPQGTLSDEETLRVVNRKRELG